MRRKTWTFVVGLGAMVLAACAAPAERPQQRPASGGEQPAAASTGQARAMSIVVRYEVNDLHGNTISRRPGESTKRLFNAGLALIDGKGAAQPYLAESLPRLNTDSWRVFPDGRMETTYRLRPGLTWQDGQPLTAEDFAFAYRAYVAPGLNLFASDPQDRMESVVAVDPRTVLIQWSRPYPDAGALKENFPPLPRHIMEQPFAAFEQDPGTSEVLFNHPFWATEYISAGPFRVVDWVQGSQIEGVAFDGHVLGRPKVDRVIVKIMADENTVLSNMLSENVTLATDFTLRHEHAVVLKREWGASQRGVALLYPRTRHYSWIQFRPDYQKTPALLDVRVRRALAHSIDRQALNEGLFDGDGIMTESFVPPGYPYYDEVQRTITKYPYDPRRTEQLMNEAGFTKDRGGLFASAAGVRFQPDFWVEQGSLFERELVIFQDTWARSGIEVQPYVLPAVQVGDNQARATFPGIATPSTGIGERFLRNFTSGEVGSPANRWVGGGHGGWSNPEVDRLWVAFNTLLERSERDKQIVQMMKIVSDELPAFAYYFNLGVIAHLANVRGPDPGAPETWQLWNVHEWEFR